MQGVRENNTGVSVHLSEHPMKWLRLRVHALMERRLYSVGEVQPLFVQAIIAVINLNISHLGASISKREEVLSVGRLNLNSTLQVEVSSEDLSFHPQGFEHYRYLLVYLKDVFSTYACLFYFFSSDSSLEKIQLVEQLLRLTDYFLEQPEREIEIHWKRMNQHAAHLVAARIPAHYEWRKMFKTIFPFIQPYLAFDKLKKESLSILTRLDEIALLNIPDAPAAQSEVQFGPFPRGSLFQSVPRFQSVWDGLGQDFLSPVELPFNSQVENFCQLRSGSSLPRNTRFQLTGRLNGDVFEIKTVTYQVATPAIPTDMWGGFLRIFNPHHRSRRAAQLRDFCHAYWQTVKTRCATMLPYFISTPLRSYSHVEVHLVSNLFPPEPDSIDAMRGMQVSGLSYINAPFKDFQGYGVSRIDFPLTHVLERVLRQLAHKNQLDRTLIDYFYASCRCIDSKSFADKNVNYLVQKAASVGLNPSVSDLEAMMSWFFVLLLEHRYDERRREDKFLYWDTSFKRALNRLSQTAHHEFMSRWNVFVNLNPQIAAITTLLALMVEEDKSYQSFEGCKSAKDRATELLVFKAFVRGVLFNESNRAINMMLRQQLIHNLVFLMLYAHVPGAMKSNTYTDTKKLREKGDNQSAERLELLNNAMRELRHGAAKYRCTIFAGQKPNRVNEISFRTL
jgi:hypothetical protein